MTKTVSLLGISLAFVVGCNSSSEFVSEAPSTAQLDTYEINLCDGYLTRVEGDDFCADEIPNDWVPFTFNGKTYYMQPLAGT